MIENKVNIEIFLIIWIICLVIGIYIIWMIRKKKYSVFNKFTLIKYSIYFFIFAIVLLLFIFDIIEIYFITGISYVSGMLWMFINSLVLGMILLATGLTTGKSTKWFHYFILFMVLVLSISGLGYVGFLIKINIPLFVYPEYQTNGIKGVWFYTLNSYLWIGIIFVSTIFEKEKE